MSILQPTPDELAVIDQAKMFARKNKKRIARLRADIEKYSPEESPIVSVFMAGSPGAGKTEASKALLQGFDEPILRIDPDELRAEFAEYRGDNSWQFHAASSILVDCIHDLALKQRQSFILDGTLSNFDKAAKNIRRSLSKGRKVSIHYVYQEPMLAWKFVLAREKLEGRRIEMATFIEQFFAARNNVDALKAQFGKDVDIALLIKDFDNSDKIFRANVDQIANHVPVKYDKCSLEKALVSH